MDIEVSSTEVSQAADAKRTEASDQVEQKESVDSTESEITEESETSEDADASNEEDAEGTSDDDEAEETEGKEQKKPDLPKGALKRIGKLTKQREEAKQEAEYWKREALKRQEQQPQKEEPAKPQVQTSEGEPQEDDFENHKDYLKAVVKWEYAQEKLMDEQKNREVQVRTEYQTKAQAFKAKVDAFSEANPDYDDAVDSVKDVILSPGLEQSIFESELPGELMLELANNRSELERINSLTPLAAAREIGKIEARLQKQASKVGSLKKRSRNQSMTRTYPSRTTNACDLRN
jgi:hypothetical protein